MPLVVWGVDEVLEAIGAIYVIVVGLVFLLVRLERTLYADPSRSAEGSRRRRQSRSPENHPDAS